MRFIPTRVHAVLDYVVSLFVMALPFLFGLAGQLRWGFVALGVAGLVYSLLTDYELGAMRAIPMRTHLALDILFIAGLLALAIAVPVTGLRIVCVIAAVTAGLLVAFTRREPAG